jgi:copper ion binding protein
MSEQPVSQQFRISGMTCGHCVQAVTEELSSLDGVQSVEVDLDSGTATVRSAAELDRDAVRDAVDEAGYELV